MIHHHTPHTPWQAHVFDPIKSTKTCEDNAGLTPPHCIEKLCFPHVFRVRIWMDLKYLGSNFIVCLAATWENPTERHWQIHKHVVCPSVLLVSPILPALFLASIPLFSIISRYINLPTSQPSHCSPKIFEHLFYPISSSVLTPNCSDLLDPWWVENWN